MRQTADSVLIIVHIVTSYRPPEQFALCGQERRYEEGLDDPPYVHLPLEHIKRFPLHEHETLCEKCVESPKYVMLLLKNLND